MRILAIDVGTGTQDILLFDSTQELENSLKLIMPSPTLVVAGQIRRATEQRKPLVLRGVTMGGGPCHWATMDHVRAGLPVYATPEAARTFDDDLESVAEMGIQLVSEDELGPLRDAQTVELRDLWLDLIVETLERFGVEPRLDALAVAAFDHGAAPPGYSDRTFRFDYLADRLRAHNSLITFAFRRAELPASLTRLAAVAASAPRDLPLIAMDTAPAAVLGALEDPVVSQPDVAIVANVGNFHCLAFRIEAGRISGLFEHHSGELTSQKLGRYVEKLADGTLTNQEVFDDMGHGALVLRAPSEVSLPFLAVTGPKRGLLLGSGLRPYLAVPHGDMMLAGCFGLLRAYAALEPSAREPIESRLGSPPTPISR